MSYNAGGLAEHILDVLYPHDDIQPFESFVLRLSQRNPGVDGRQLHEPASQLGYSPKHIANDNSSWAQAVITEAGIVYKENLQAIDYEPATGPWPVITHWALYGVGWDGETFLCSGPLSINRPVQQHDVLRIRPGMIKITANRAGV